MTSDYLTEEQWNDIYDKMYDAVSKALFKNGKTEKEARETVEKIKNVFVKNPEPEQQIN